MRTSKNLTIRIYYWLSTDKFCSVRFGNLTSITLPEDQAVKLASDLGIKIEHMLRQTESEATNV